MAVLSSSCFFWFWNAVSDCRNLNRRDILAFPLNLEQLSEGVVKELDLNGLNYLETLRASSHMMTKSGLLIETFQYSACKPIIDDIDRVLAKHYDLTDEEFDFMLNYDIKYRLGGAEAGEE